MTPYTIPDKSEAILFDCDGTLVDTMALHWEAIHQTLGNYGVKVPQSYLEQFAGVPMPDIVVNINKTFHTTLEPLKLSREKEDLLYPFLSRSLPIEPIIAIAKKYHQKLPMAVVSGGVKKNIVASLEAVGILDLFSVIISAEDPIKPKPHPDPFLAAAKRLSVSPDRCHVFEDADSGITAAKIAGMTFTDVRSLQLK